MASKIGILGSGAVGLSLAKGFKKHGYEVQIGRREASGVDGWDGPVGTFSDVSAWGDLVIIALKGSIAEEVVESVTLNLAGKTVIDTTNPIAETPNDEGVLHFFTSLEDSLMERLQKLAPEAHFVKAFNIVGNAQMVSPSYETKPTMFICGNDHGAKVEVSEILDKFGWEVEDCGGVKSARAIEPLCILWCIPGFLRGEWSHAFKLLKP
jgi:predicted dinucleotide-binding enzyme